MRALPHIAAKPRRAEKSLPGITRKPPASFSNRSRAGRATKVPTCQYLTIKQWHVPSIGA